MTIYLSGATVFGGDVVYAADLNAIVSSLPRTYTKDTVTPRNTVTSYADDPHLAGIPLEPGAYNIELTLFYTVASTTPRLKTQWAFSGTSTNPIRVCHGPGTTQTGGPESVTDVTMRGYAMTTQDAIYSSSTSAAYSAVVERVRGLEVTVAGDLSLRWAQVTSNAANVNVQPGSAFTVQRIGDL